MGSIMTEPGLNAGSKTKNLMIHEQSLAKMDSLNSPRECVCVCVCVWARARARILLYVYVMSMTPTLAVLYMMLWDFNVFSRRGEDAC